MEKPNQSPDAIPNGNISEKIIHSLADIGAHLCYYPAGMNPSNQSGSDESLLLRAGRIKGNKKVLSNFWVGFIEVGAFRRILIKIV